MEKPRKITENSARLMGVPSETRTRHLPNASPKRLILNQLTGPYHIVSEVCCLYRLSDVVMCSYLTSFKVVLCSFDIPRYSCVGEVAFI